MPAVTFGDGEHIDENILDYITETAVRLTTPLVWETGDVALVDNKRVMHGRHPFSGSNKREIVVSLAKG